MTAAAGFKYISAMHDITLVVDQNLKSLGACTGQPPAAGIFSVGHGCSYNEPPTTAAGQLRCAAGTINEPPGADLEFDIVFEWTYDGATVPNESKQVYARDDKHITPGEHTVTVVAIDTRTNSRSEGSTFRFTKPGAELAVTVQCALRSGQNDAVACYADPQNVPEGATLTYEWTWDGALQGETGRTLPKDKLADGLYIITVRATDSKSGKTAQASTTVQVGTPSSTGKPYLQTPEGKQPMSPDERVRREEDAHERIELLLDCARQIYDLVKIQHPEWWNDTENPLSPPSVRTYQIALMAGKLCQLLIGARPYQVAYAGFGGVSGLATKSAESPAVQVQIDIEQGLLGLEVMNKNVALDVGTGTATVSAQGLNTFAVGYDPTTNESVVAVSEGQVTVQPKNPMLAPVTLQNGRQVRVTKDNVSSPTAIPKPGPNSTIVLAVAILGGASLLGLLGLFAGIMTSTRSRRQPAQPAAPPLVAPRPTDLPERGAQRKPPKPTDLPER